MIVASPGELDRTAPSCDSPPMDAPRGRGRESLGGGGIDLEPALVLPAQIFAGSALNASLVPEKRLLLAVLEEAVVTFQ